MSEETRSKGPVEVTVNNHKVKIHTPATGREIKQAAIDAGVPIELDFDLELEKGDETLPIGDNQKIDLQDGDKFTAADGDDNA